MMSNTPRVFVGTTTFLISGMTSEACLQTVKDAINGHTGVRVVYSDLTSGLITVTADQPVDRSDLAAAIARAGYNVLA